MYAFQRQSRTPAIGMVQDWKRSHADAVYHVVGV